MEENSYLRSAIFEVVDNQLEANDPPETRQTLDRLIAEGHSEEEAKNLIACVVAAEIFDVLKNHEPSNPERFLQGHSRIFQNFLSKHSAMHPKAMILSAVYTGCFLKPNSNLNWTFLGMWIRIAIDVHRRSFYANCSDDA